MMILLFSILFFLHNYSLNSDMLNNTNMINIPMPLFTNEKTTILPFFELLKNTQISYPTVKLLDVNLETPNILNEKFANLLPNVNNLQFTATPLPTATSLMKLPIEPLPSPALQIPRLFSIFENF